MKILDYYPTLTNAVLSHPKTEYDNITNKFNGLL